MDEVAEDEVRPEGARVAVPGELRLLLGHALGALQEMRLVHQAVLAHEAHLAVRTRDAGGALHPAADRHFQEARVVGKLPGMGEDPRDALLDLLLGAERHDADAVDEAQAGVQLRPDLGLLVRLLVDGRAGGRLADADRALAAAEVAGVGEVVGGGDTTA